jgi:hypothetical protein
MKLRSNFDSAGIFQGFSVLDCYGGGEWSSASDYKSIVLAYRRALIDANASPVPARRSVVENGYVGIERRAT